MTTILVTGANRGIGHEHVRQALAAGETVIATCRAVTPGDALDELRASHAAGRLRVEPLDVADRSSIDALADRLAGVAIDVLVNNAGVYGPPGARGWPDGAATQTLQGMDYDLWEDMLRINVMAPFRLTARLLPNILAGDRRLVVMMTSGTASIANNLVGSSHAYRSSKAALNMLARGLAADLRADGVTVVALAPGWTQTELGGDGAIWTVADSIVRQRGVLATLGLDQSGRYIDLNGVEVPW